MRYLAIAAGMLALLVPLGSFALPGTVPGSGAGGSALPDLNGTWKEANGAVWKITGNAASGSYTVTWSGVGGHSGLRGTGSGTFDGTTFRGTHNITEASVRAEGDFSFRYVAPGATGRAKLTGTLHVTNDIDYVRRAFTVTISKPLKGGGERFDFRIEYRLKPATTTSPNCAPTPGTVSGHGNAIVLGGTVNASGLVDREASFTVGCRTANISMRVLSAELSVERIGVQRSIRTVHAVVKISARSGHNGADCYVGTRGTLTVVDSDALLRPQGIYADSFILGGWDNPCVGHRHGWSNTNPGSVGPGNSDGSFLGAVIVCSPGVGRTGGLSARNCDAT